MQDPPPEIPPEERLSPEALRRLARDLLREMAQHDPGLAERLRREGIDLEG